MIYTSDKELAIDLFLNGNEWQRDFPLQTRWPIQALNVSEAIRAQIPVAKLANTLEFYTIDNDSMIQPLSDWTQFTKSKKLRVNIVLLPPPVVAKKTPPRVEPIKDECTESEKKLVVDIFYNNQLIRTQETMPLTHWERDTIDDDEYTNLFLDAKEYTGISEARSISVLVADTKPKERIDWFGRRVKTAHYIDCSQVREYKNKYVAIGLSMIGYQCAICLNEARFAHKELGELFCGQTCYNTFRLTQ